MEVSTGGFDPSYFPLLAEWESKNFWFRARNELILWAIQKFFHDSQSFLEIGCGTGFVLEGVSRRFPQIRLTGSELFEDGLLYSRQRLPKADLIQMNAESIPFESEFDLVGAFDVLEHINEDEETLRQIYKALKPTGGLIITVPQHRWLWSPSDDLAQHVRRYSRQEMKQKLDQAGFEIVKVTSFVSLLLPLMYASRLKQRKGSAHSVLDELRIGGLLNEMLKSILDVERYMIRSGCDLPVGGSLLVVARKKSHT